jgi:hypothetical protein
MAEVQRMTVDEVVSYFLEGEGLTICASRWLGFADS